MSKKSSLLGLLAAIVVLATTSLSAQAFQPMVQRQPIFPGNGFHTAANRLGSESLTTSSKSYSYDIDLMTGRKPCVIWSHEATGAQQQIRFACWNGTKWAGLANPNGFDQISSSPKAKLYPFLAIDAYDTPHVIWHEYANVTVPYGHTPPTEIKYANWNGSSWSGYSGQGPDTISLPGKYANVTSRPSDITINNATNRPGVVWADKDSVYYRAWNGSQWSGIFANADYVTYAPGEHHSPQLAYDYNGKPQVAWQHTPYLNSPVNDIYFSHLGPSSWKGKNGQGPDVVSSGTGSTTNHEPELVVIGGWNVPAIAWRSTNYQNKPSILFRRWDPQSQTWKGFGSSVDKVNGNKGAGALSMDVSVSMTVGIAWTAPTGNADSKVWFKQWTGGTTWKGMTGNAAQLVSRNVSNSMDPKLVMDDFGLPQVTWTHFIPTAAMSEVYFTHWKNWSQGQ